MREIKFRAWIKTTKEMITQETISDYILVGNGTGFGVIDGSDDSEYGTGNVWLEDKDFELMQFTGMLDKNGVEIYEGDIVSGGFSEHIGIVRFGMSANPFNSDEWTGHLGYYIQWQEKDIADFTRVDLGYWTNKEMDTAVRVVGNIYENPELLGTKSDIAVDIGFKEATNE